MIQKILLIGWVMFVGSSYAAEPIALKKIPLSIFAGHVSGARSLATADDFQHQEAARISDPAHNLHIKIFQTFHGYRVFGTDSIIHVVRPQASTQSLRSIASDLPKEAVAQDGVFYQRLEDDLGPFSASDWHVREGIVKNAIIARLTEEMRASLDIQKLTLEPVVYVDTQHTAHYAFYVSVFLFAEHATRPLARDYIVDAENNQILEQWSTLKTKAVQAGGLGGNLKQSLFYDNTTSHLPAFTVDRVATSGQCYMKNDYTRLFDFDAIKSWENVKAALRQRRAIAVFSCPTESSEYKLYWSADFGTQNGGYSPNNDALFAGGVLLKMYQDWYGLDVRKLLDPAGNPVNPVNMIAHVADPDDGETALHPAQYHPFENAFWTDYYNAIFLGDGGNTMYPLTSLSVIAHEITHGVTSHRALGDLVYSNQSGALNESFSDMAAQALQYYVHGAISDDFGAEIMKAPNTALRYMDKPSKDCAEGKQAGDLCSIDHVSQYAHLRTVASQYARDPDTVQSIIVHYASGIFNRAFYTLAAKPGWDPRRAFALMLWAHQYYWKPTTNFQDAACGVMHAGHDLQYDATALQDIVHAFQTVGISVAACTAS